MCIRDRLYGMGELHLEVLVDRLMREFKVGVNVGQPRVAYRETITRAVNKVEGRFVRQSGGRGQFGHVVLDVEPLEPGSGFVFENAIIGGSIPREFIGPAEAGIKEALQSGILAGYPVVDIKAKLDVYKRQGPGPGRGCGLPVLGGRQL